MKLSIAIADTYALPSAFVVYRGFEECIPKAARLGFQGIELALRRAEEININLLERLLRENNIEVSCISTGQVFADGGLTITHKDPRKRQQVKKILEDLIDLAAGFGKIVNIGRIRGPIGEVPKPDIEKLFINMARELCLYAQSKDVTLILEPINRYEIDFINTIEEGVQLMRQVNMPNMKLMPDVFHMNIEDTQIGPELLKNIQYIEYIHFADSNRKAPGWGHLNFPEIFDNLLKANYDGWISAEILPKPDPDAAAKQTAEFLLPLIETYNSARKRLNHENEF